MQEKLVSKSEFAALINVSPGRVSQFITAGQISAAALVGSGQRAKINVDRARSDLRLTLDISQRLGNGLDTRLDDAPPPISHDGPAIDRPSVAPPVTPSGIDYEIKQQKLEQIRRANRNAAIADAQSSGVLIETEASKAAMLRVAASMLLTFEGGLADFASAIASEYKVPQRDVLHLLRREFRKVRANATKQAEAESINLPETTETLIEADEIETIN